MPHPSTIPRLILLPGLGADERLFVPQRTLPVQIEVPQWLEPIDDREALERYAQRMARQVQPSEDDLWLGGVSFGAMVACEMARHLPRTRGVIMIGGCLSHRQIGSLFKLTCHVGHALPKPVVKLALSLFPVVLDILEDLSAEHRQLYVQMVSAASTRWIQWGAKAMTSWTFQGPAPRPIYDIHGELDEMIPLRGVKPTYVVPRGKHLVSLSHPNLVNQHIMGCIETKKKPQISQIYADGIPLESA